MTFGIFVGWVLAGLLAGVVAGLVVKDGGHGLKGDVYLGLAGGIGGSWLLRMIGAAPGNSMLAGAVVAFILGAVLIGAQRRFRPVTRALEPRATLWRWGLGAAVAAVMIWMTLAPASQPAATAAAVQDRTYTVTPPTMTLKAGIVTAELTDMKVTERVEEGSGRVVAPAKLTGRVLLKNTSRDQSIRLVSGRLRYADAAGHPIKLEDARAEPAIKFSGSASDRLDPGQETSESVEVEFPVAALVPATLKSIHLDLAYVPSPYREETARFAVAIGAQ
jgi:uncharacterized membrane protein YeaQ/YmgE (transglycosylase-associated protein family)